MNPGGFVVALVLAVLILGGAFVVLSTYNEIVSLAQRIDKAWANIDVALKQRYDELPNLVEAVRGLMGFEQGVLERVTQARAGYRPDAPIPQQAATSEETTGAVKSLLAVVEHYPDLTAHENVMSLQAEIARLEGVIADRRELYNDMVYRYDARIQQVPAVLLASLFGWRPRPYFKAQPGETAVPDTTLTPG
ncbi:MAG TPA: LemA family protein [Candidatus Sulfotelmatobacter sp.]|nr:LemA family protein [Candidatus Sulfotelmatobacter sp.]